MPFSFVKDTKTLILTLIGDIDLEITPEIKNQLQTRLDDTQNFTIDASQVGYIDSSGISILVIAMQTCNKNNVSFSISKASDELMRVIELAHLGKLLPIEEKTGPADLVDVDVFSKTGQKDGEIAQNLDHPDDETIARELHSLTADTSVPETEPEAGKTKENKETKETKDSDSPAAIEPDSPFKPGTF